VFLLSFFLRAFGVSVTVIRLWSSLTR